VQSVATDDNYQIFSWYCCNISTLRRLCEDGTAVHLTFLDMRKAYDSVAMCLLGEAGGK
jgi:hypothetical protein